jgi:predicted enzyme related to lactoylglutathione lyase
LDAQSGRRDVITGLVGVTIWTQDLDGMFHFYGETLRMPLHSRHDDFIAFQLGENLRFNIGLHNGVAGSSQDPYRIMAHLGVEDIHSEYRRLSEGGVEFIRVPQQEHWGGWIATFKDPDGNILQMLQFPE